MLTPPPQIPFRSPPPAYSYDNPVDQLAGAFAAHDYDLGPAPSTPERQTAEERMAGAYYGARPLQQENIGGMPFFSGAPSAPRRPAGEPRRIDRDGDHMMPDAHLKRRLHGEFVAAATRSRRAGELLPYAPDRLGVDVIPVDRRALAPMQPAAYASPAASRAGSVARVSIQDSGFTVHASYAAGTVRAEAVATVEFDAWS